MENYTIEKIGCVTIININKFPQKRGFFEIFVVYINMRG